MDIPDTNRKDDIIRRESSMESNTIRANQNVWMLREGDLIINEHKLINQLKPNKNDNQNI